MSVARVSFFNRLKKANKPEIKLVSSVHDSIVTDTPSKHKDWINQTFIEVFQDLPKNIEKIFGYKWKVPLACEVKFGNNLKDMQKIA